MMRADDPRHGTYAGYMAHRKDSSPLCEPCNAARVAYDRQRRNEAARRSIPSGPTARLLQELIAHGWAFAVLERKLGLTSGRVHKLAHGSNPDVYVTTALAVQDLHADLIDVAPPQTTRVEKWQYSYARTAARKNGWLTDPPLTASTVAEKFCGCHPYMPNEWTRDGYQCMGCGWNMLFGQPRPRTEPVAEPALPEPTRLPLARPAVPDPGEAAA